MNKGKNTCKILKEIRRQIAEANDIEFITSEPRNSAVTPNAGTKEIASAHVPNAKRKCVI